MSRIGRKPIPVPAGVEITIDGQIVKIKGPKGELQHTLSEPIIVEREEGQLVVVRPNDERKAKELHGLSRTLVANMIVGVTEGYKKSLEINGTGYRVAAKGSDLEFALGFSHPVVVAPPAGITFAVERPTLFHISGIDKQLVGEVAANIRKIRPPEPYKGKGVKYQGEVIRRKAGKAGKAGKK
jgi:large subunit ribosomal protein L6